MELTLAWLPFEQEAIARAEILQLGSTTLPVALAEDLVIYKAVAGRARDRADLERLLLRHGDEIDYERVRRVLGQFADALDDATPVEMLEDALARIGPPGG